MSFHFELVSPEKLLFQGDVSSVIVPAAHGEMTVLANHAPTMAVLNSGIVSIASTSGQVEKLYVNKGFIDINQAGLTLLAQVAIPMQSLDVIKLQTELSQAQEKVKSVKSSQERLDLEDQIENLQNMIKVVE